MKLRLTKTMIRLRLGRDELAQFTSAGRITVTVAITPKTSFTYALERDAEANQPTARLSRSALTVHVPPAVADTWASTDQIGFEAEQETGNDAPLQILVEKDLGCQHKETDDENAFEELADASDAAS